MTLNETVPMNPVNLAILGTLLGGVGKVLKEMPKFPNQYIPAILGVLGGIALGWMEGFSPATIFFGVNTGLGVVGVHQVVTQLTPEKKEENKDAIQK